MDWMKMIRDEAGYSGALLEQRVDPPLSIKEI
jgi:hypothetical protein